MAFGSQEGSRRLEDMSLGTIGGGQDYKHAALGKAVGELLPVGFGGEQACRHEGEVIESDVSAIKGARWLCEVITLHRLVASITFRAFCRPICT